MGLLVNASQIKALVGWWARRVWDSQKKMGELGVRSVKSVGAPEKGEKRLAQRFSEAIRERHYSRRTEKAYWYWIRYFIIFHGKRHPVELGAAEVTAFLSWLASERNVAAATQNQALSALVFLYKHVLGEDLPWLAGLVRAQRTCALR